MIFIVVGSKPVFAHAFFAHAHLSAFFSSCCVCAGLDLAGVSWELLSPLCDWSRSGVSDEEAMTGGCRPRVGVCGSLLWLRLNHEAHCMFSAAQVSLALSLARKDCQQSVSVSVKIYCKLRKYA